MFSALKKIITNENATDSKGKPPSGGFQAMGQNLQRRFAKGVQYNMKIIIKGDRNVGKTTLFHRLQGHKFKEEYIPTQEIQVCSIQWNYKATDDVVKVEVWDVVDKGRSRKVNDNMLKISNDEVDEPADEPCLDAEFLDVYKGTNGVVMLMDITKHWTFSYIERELPKIPNHIPVVVLANFRDMSEHRTVLEEHISTFVEEFKRPPGSAHVRYAESSMKNGFGLKYLHTFFNVPFLQLQRETLLRQLETNQLEADATLEELNMRLESEDQNYDLYLETLENRRKQRQNRKQEKLTNGTPQITLDPCSTNSQSTTPVSTPNQSSPATTPQRTTPSTSPNTQRRNPQRNESPQPEVATPSPPPPSQSNISRFGRFFGSKKSKEPVAETVADIPPLAVPAPTKEAVSNVDDFIPDGGSHNEFWKDVDKASKKVKKTAIKQQKYDSDSDEADGNPMVAGFQEDLDSEDEANFTFSSNTNIPTSPANDSEPEDKPTPKTTSKDIELSSSEDEQPVVSQDVDFDMGDFSVLPKKPSSNKQLTDFATKNPRILKQESLPPPVESSDEESDTEQTNQKSRTSSTDQEQQKSRTSSTDQEQQKSRTSSTDQEPLQSPAPVISLDLHDLDFLESVGAKNNKTKNLNRHISDEFDILVSVKETDMNNDIIEDSLSDADTTSTNSSTKKKKKKHKNKEKRKDKAPVENEEKTKKHKHKKSKDKERDIRKETDTSRRRSKDKKDDTGEKKKKKKPPQVENIEDADMDAFEAFLEGKGDTNYEAF